MCIRDRYMPSTSKKILEQLGNGHVTEKPEILFQRMDLEEVLKKVEELHPKKEEKKEEAVIDLEPKEEITFEQFGAMQFQVGEIIACEAVKKSKKPVSYTHLETDEILSYDFEDGLSDKSANEYDAENGKNAEVKDGELRCV